MEINKYLSKQLHVKPLVEGQKVEFRIWGSGLINPKTRLPKKMAGLNIPGTARIKDPGDGGTVKVIENVTGYNNVKKKNGTFRQVPIVERVRFGSSNSIHLNSTQNDTYGFLVRHPRNGSNPYRDKTKAPYFLQINMVTAAADSLKKESFELDARIIVRDADRKQLTDLAQRFKLKADREAVDIRKDMVKIAKSRPIDVIKASTKVDIKAKVQIHEATELQFIGFHEKDRTWYWKDTETDAEIASVPVGKEPIEELIKHFKSAAGKEAYSSLVTKLKTIAEMV